ncbi:MAG TPA: ATP-binding protein [Acidimicrobiales bacterium]|nr:ATP-binding protein [Acidimicrobiales bacterium]
MVDQQLAEALRRLDARLLLACDQEERRSTLLAGSGRSGWEGVRNLVRPSVGDLVPDEGTAEPLLPGDDSVFRRVGKALALEECELEALLVVLAPHVEPRYSSVYAVLQDDLSQSQPTVRLLFSLVAREPHRRAVLADSLGQAGRLVRSGFLSRVPGTFPPLGQPLGLPEDVTAALLGSSQPAVPDAIAQRWAVGRSEEGSSASWQVVYGSGDRSAMARSLADAGAPVVEVAVPPRPADPAAVCRAAWRVGMCTGALPLIDVAELEDGDVAPVARGLHELVNDLGGRAWLLCRNPVPLAVPHVEATSPSWASRRRGWIDEAERRGAALEEGDADRLAARHRLDRPEVARVFDVAPSLDADTLDEVAARMGVEHVRHSARSVPVRTFDDLVLRDTTRDGLDRLVHYVRTRDRVAFDLGLERRYRLARGPVALFAGRSGTGKTLAAEAVAAALGRPLHTVDLARLVSKYIGETEKHIDEVLTQAERASAVLFFDEADALFSNRLEKASNSSEHFANMLVGYLLQRIEVHDGLVILATNLRHAIDEAFLRRFQFRIEFPLPEPDERLRIWELMLAGGMQRADDVDLASLAHAHRLAGGDIRNAALKAIFLAHRTGRPLAQDDLERAVALELLEMGRLSRREDSELRMAEGADGVGPDRGELLRACLDDVHDQLDAYLRGRFLKEIHLVHGSPTEERLAGKRPAVSIALYRLAARRGDDGLRAGLIVSTWANLAEEESELLGVVHQALSGMALAPVRGHDAKLRVQESHDFDLLHRFWSSHEHPVRASVVVDVEIE